MENNIANYQGNNKFKKKRETMIAMLQQKSGNYYILTVNF